ncbi:254_t:CDS:1 [Acaulospora morrowiae]|uniref:254_t:CDS:1 n=1 Tax=Acaulospora morrowiae TaxID=94023 RepID=A0A9N9B694_9GLOM|nr:254_t:CDS:1 [Acaulospora morrowiae]
MEEDEPTKDIIQGTPNNENQERTTNVPIETFYFVKLRKKFRKWEKLQSLSYVNLIITALVCLTSLIVGVFLLVSTKNVVESKARNTLSVIFSGIVSTFSLSGCLASLKNLIFRSKLDTMKKLYAEENELKVTRCVKDWEPRGENEVPTKPGRDDEIYNRKELYFMSKLAENMRRMLIFRILWAILFSIILTALAGFSIYILLTDDNNDIFLLIDKYLIIVSSVFLLIILNVFFLIKVIIPRLVSELYEYTFDDKIKILELYKKKKDKSTTFKVLSILFGVQILSLSFAIGMLVPIGFKIRRTQMTEKEMNIIMQRLSGIPKVTV